ncbi:unnamed protein product, partial [Symbiodinium sp. KB8]
MTVMEMFVAFGMMMVAYFFMTQMNQNNNQNNTGSSDKDLLARKPKKKHANKLQPRRSRKVSEEEDEEEEEPGEEQVPVSSAGGEAKGEDPAQKGDKANLEAAPQDDTERQLQHELQARADEAVRRVEEAVQSMQEVTKRMQEGETMLKTLQGRMDKVVQDMDGIGGRRETLIKQHHEMKTALKDMETYMMQGEPQDEHSDHGSDGATSQPDNVHDAPADHSTNDGASDGIGGNPDDGAADGDAGNQNDGTGATQDGGKGKGPPGQYQLNRFKKCGYWWLFNTHLQEYKVLAQIAKDGGKGSIIPSPPVKGRKLWQSVIDLFTETGQWCTTEQDVEKCKQQVIDEKVQKRMAEMFQQATQGKGPGPDGPAQTTDDCS